MENGQYEIDGENLFAIVNSYTTQPREERFWEAHRQYIDIQFMVAGTERMGVSRLQEMKETQSYNEEKDFSLFEGTGNEFEVPSGYFTIFFPTDVHMPNLVAGTPESVKKVVLKVKIQEPLISLVFASNNQNKLDEIRRCFNLDQVRIQSLKEAGIKEELPERGSTLEENAWQKADHVYSTYGLSCFADDTGLEVEALDGEPGVYSARYAGKNATSEQNVEKLLQEMSGIANRKAEFRTVIALIMDATEFRFEGTVKGTIAQQPKGKGGFGYDPVFIPDGYSQTFAEMTIEQKNKISHRSIATEKLVRFLRDKMLSSDI